MKTPMQEVYENFNLMSDADFKAWMLNTDLLEKEKEMFIEISKNSYIAGYLDNQAKVDESMNFPQEYYNETFNTKEG